MNFHPAHSVVCLLPLTVALVCAGACTPSATTSSRAGEFELAMEAGTNYALIGRFELVGDAPSATSHSMRWDARVTRARVRVPAGWYELGLAPGALLVCPEDDTAGSWQDAPGPRLVSAPPQKIRITAGELTTATIASYRAPAANRAPAEQSGAPRPSGPCESERTEWADARALAAH